MTIFYNAHVSFSLIQRHRLVKRDTQRFINRFQIDIFIWGTSSSLYFIPQRHFRLIMKLSYELLVCCFAYLGISSVCSMTEGGYVFSPCTDTDMLSSSRCLLLEAEVGRECDCQSLCDEDDRCVVMFFSPDTKKCRLYDQHEDQIVATGMECARIIDCGDPAFEDDMDVKYTSTTYGSVAEIECPLGYFPTAEPLQSSCQSSGQWSKLTGVCKEIPGLVTIKELPNSDANLECRNVISPPAIKFNERKKVWCAPDEIMTGCSSTPHGDGGEPGASQIGTSLSCFIRVHAGPNKDETTGSKAVARCCKLPGLRCEYVYNNKYQDSTSCFKDFSLFDCTCRWPYPTSGSCPGTMNGNQCLTATKRTYTEAICCDLGDYSCYRKKVTGLESADSDYLRIRCDNVGEVMTSCSGYSIDSFAYDSLIRDVDGTDECQLDPGPGNITALYGYATCCKRQQK